MSKSPTDLQRIEIALDTASAVLLDFTPGRIASTRKKGGDPVTEADIAVDDALRSVLLTDSEGWLSEETTDSLDRLDRSRVWIVDPIDAPWFRCGTSGSRKCRGKHPLLPIVG